MTTIINDVVLESLANTLHDTGLNLMTALSVEAQGAEIWLDQPSVVGGSILLLGNGGPQFWEALSSEWPDVQDPVDHFSAQKSEYALQGVLGAVKRKRLFPTDNCAVALQRLMVRAGWHTPSPLGMGMHATYGLWSACRAIWWLDADLEQNFGPSISPVDHCLSCVSKACVNTCPANALTSENTPQLSRCADFRLQASSDCEQTCVARESCPIAVEHRYLPAQLNYHYGLARSAIARYRSETHDEYAGR